MCVWEFIRARGKFWVMISIVGTAVWSYLLSCLITIPVVHLCVDIMCGCTDVFPWYSYMHIYQRDSHRTDGEVLQCVWLVITWNWTRLWWLGFIRWNTAQGQLLLSVLLNWCGSSAKQFLGLLTTDVWSDSLLLQSVRAHTKLTKCTFYGCTKIKSDVYGHNTK